MDTNSKTTQEAKPFQIPCYVTATDSCLSGWGGAEGKIDKLVFYCETRDEADIVEGNLKARSEMKRVSMCSKRPTYQASRYVVHYKNKETSPAFYKPGWFANQKRSDRGQGVVEYGLLVCLVAMVAVICMTIFWPAIVQYWQQLTTMM